MINFSKPRQSQIIFFSVFIVSFIFLCLRWNSYIMVDSGMWAAQSHYFFQGDSREFDFLNAYGHPGGPIIEGTIVIHKLFNTSYLFSEFVFIILICSIFIAGICTICFLLNKDKLWWIAVLSTLLFSWLYQYGTPPSIISTLIVSFLCLLTLYLYERNEYSSLPLLLWGITAGMSVATRADIGSIVFISFIFILFKKIDWGKIKILLITSFLSFFLFDPFMWFMPIQHLTDLLYKVIYHYSDFSINHLSVLSVFSISTITFIGIILALLFLLSPQKLNFLPLPRVFLWTLIVTTVVLYGIFLSSNFQAQRYFLPIIFIWEILFPLLFFSLIDKMNINSKKFIKIFIIIFFALCNIIILTQNIWTCSPSCIFIK